MANARAYGAAGVLDRVGRRLNGRVRNYQIRRFDRRYQVETERWVNPNEFGLTGPSANDAIRYEPITEGPFRRMMRSIPVDDRQSVFVDIGSGKGKALMLAARYPFKRVIGVEFVPEIHRIAQANVAAFRRKCQSTGAIELVCMNAIDWNWPDDDLVVFLYNPFVGDTFRRVLTGLTRSLIATPRRIRILYRNPVCATMIDELQIWRPLERQAAYHIYGSP